MAMATLLKKPSVRHINYVVNQKLEHVDDIGFREHFGGIIIMFVIRFVPSDDKVFEFMLAILFHETQLD